MSGSNGLVWVLSIVLAVVFVLVGLVRAYRYETAKKIWPWVSELPQGLVQIIGVVEWVCGLGLILPVALGRYTYLTPAAASILMLLLVSALTFHVRRREFDNVWLVGLLLALVGAVAYLRLDLLVW